MKLEDVITSWDPGEAVGRTSWYMNDIGYQPRLRRATQGYVRRNKNPTTGETTLDPYVLTDEDRLANDWVVVQSNRAPPG